MGSAHPTWMEVASERKRKIEEKIPSEWRVDKTQLQGKCLVDLPRASGLLTDKELLITELSAVQILAAMREQILTATETTIAFCKRAAISHQATNCLAEILFDDALQQAAQLDDYMAKYGKPIGMLHGLPISVKEHIKIKGTTATSGLIAWANNVSNEDALIVKIFREQGAIFYVKTTNPQTLMAIETDSNLFGRTTNPHNKSLTSGGSTGGEGALLAMNGSPLGIGTDIGGSIRVPSAFCGTYGFKPTIGRLPHSGLTGLHDGMQNLVGVVGPLARSIEDLELFCVAALKHEPWKYEPSLIEMPWRPETRAPQKLKIGVIWSDRVVQPHPPIVRALKQVVSTLTGAGHTVIDWDASLHRELYDVTNKVYFLDGGAEYHEKLDQGKEPAVPIIKWLLDEKATKHYTVEETWKVNGQLDRLRTSYAHQWNTLDIDAILCPANASVASVHDESRYWGYTCVFNALDYPAAVFPVGSVEKTDSWKSFPPISSSPLNPLDMWYRSLYLDIEGPTRYEGAPISLQLVGRRFHDEKMLRVLSYLHERVDKSQ
ncbi:Amidase [Penicillium occitanis (nom. inval.)]|nr:Amidase [Penicillium occitanis (nom. inval.)]PCG96836.1 hypothetical protein PENOC_070860 [Penicillium occitanis (nom. inval.)]